jgi:hypothetical protein
MQWSYTVNSQVPDPSSAGNRGATGGTNAVGGAGGSSAAGESGGSSPAPCTGPYDEVTAGCPAAYDGTQANLPACESNSACVLAQTCGDDLVGVEIANPFMGHECFYDATTHALVGGLLFVDDGAYRGGSSATQSAGRVGTCGDAPDFAKRSCS